VYRISTSIAAFALTESEMWVFPYIIPGGNPLKAPAFVPTSP
jgi:hypothetical protein